MRSGSRTSTHACQSSYSSPGNSRSSRSRHSSLTRVRRQMRRRKKRDFPSHATRLRLIAVRTGKVGKLSWLTVVPTRVRLRRSDEELVLCSWYHRQRVGANPSLGGMVETILIVERVGQREKKFSLTRRSGMPAAISRLQGRASDQDRHDARAREKKRKKTRFCKTDPLRLQNKGSRRDSATIWSTFAVVCVCPVRETWR